MTEQKIIFGRPGKNPELKYTKEKEPVCFFSIAEQLEGQDKPHWHNVVVWGKQAEFCSVQLKKGSLIFVRGRKREWNFKNAQGEKKQLQELKADAIGFTYS